MVLEDLREINGWLLNGKRRTRAELNNRYPTFDTSMVLTDEDVLWQAEILEEDESVRARVNRALSFLWEREEENIAVVAHGGLFKKMIDGNFLVSSDLDGKFENCELKSCSFEMVDGKFELQELPVC